MLVLIVCVCSWRNTPTDAFFAIYDGHNGAVAAEFCMGTLHQFLFKVTKLWVSNFFFVLIFFLLKSIRHHPNDPPLEHFTKAYRNVHDAMGAEVGKAGCTALTVWKQGNTLHVANAGDARAVLVRAAGPVRLSKDHKVTI